LGTPFEIPEGRTEMLSHTLEIDHRFTGDLREFEEGVRFCRSGKPSENEKVYFTIKL
jgi:hypothetical protein